MTHKYNDIDTKKVQELEELYEKCMQGSDERTELLKKVKQEKKQGLSECGEESG